MMLSLGSHMDAVVCLRLPRGHSRGAIRSLHAGNNLVPLKPLHAKDRVGDLALVLGVWFERIRITGMIEVR